MPNITSMVFAYASMDTMELHELNYMEVSAQKHAYHAVVPQLLTALSALLTQFGLPDKVVFAMKYGLDSIAQSITGSVIHVVRMDELVHPLRIVCDVQRMRTSKDIRVCTMIPK